MKNQGSNNLLSLFEEFIINFENKKLEERNNNFNYGVIYTPYKVTNFICNITFKNYFEGIFNSKFFQNGFTLKNFIQFFNNNSKIVNNLREKIKNIKILDPSCGTGRFLIEAAKFLLKIYRILFPELKEFDSKKQIIQNNLFGIEIDKDACVISKLRLIKWLFSDRSDYCAVLKDKVKIKMLEDFSSIFNEINIKLNIYNLDFLLEFDSDHQFEIIIGNPPYIENKKIKDQEYKKKLYEKFESAYKLFDLSILFIEKSLKFLRNNEGCLSFLITNKFLSADYGIKIRKMLINNTELKELINISSLPIFDKTAAYPIIISLKKRIPNGNNEILLKKYNNLENLITNNYSDSKILPQKLIKKLPAYVIPISGNLNLISYLYSNFQSMSTVIQDLKIIYRPFGFINWAKNFDLITKNKQSNTDLILIGTGNVEKYYIKFDKRIKIASKDVEVSYFKFNKKFKKKWKELSEEKLIFREIAKDLTCVYDPGIFANITGLYFIKVPSFDTNKLFSLLTIINSKLIDSVFKTLFSTLHMSGGYLRFNGSFIRRLPMPDQFPVSLSYLGKIIQFLSQLRYDLSNDSKLKIANENTLKEINNYLEFFKKLGNSLVFFLYLRKRYKKLNQNFLFLERLLKSEINFPLIQFKFPLPRFDLPKFVTAKIEELKQNLSVIRKLYLKLSLQVKLIKEVDVILQN